MLMLCGSDPLAPCTDRKQSSDARPPCLENPRPGGAESTLTENVASPFQAEPRQREYSQLYGLSLLGYYLMSNHVHLIAVPHTPEALSRSFKQAHGRYAAYWNARQSSTGHVWQGRFYSCPLDESHLWRALRYVELNPVRAGMVAAAERNGRCARPGGLICLAKPLIPIH